MKKGLPKHLLLTDPYKSIGERILILRIHSPRFVYEINPQEEEEVHRYTVEDKEYTISVVKNLDNVKDLSLSDMNSAIRWYHYGLTRKTDE